MEEPPKTRFIVAVCTVERKGKGLDKKSLRSVSSRIYFRSDFVPRRRFLSNQVPRVERGPFLLHYLRIIRSESNQRDISLGIRCSPLSFQVLWCLSLSGRENLGPSLRRISMSWKVSQMTLLKKKHIMEMPFVILLIDSLCAVAGNSNCTLLTACMHIPGLTESWSRKSSQIDQCEYFC